MPRLAVWLLTLVRYISISIVPSLAAISSFFINFHAPCDPDARAMQRGNSQPRIVP